MIYRKNLYPWEQVVRVMVGMATVAGGYWMWRDTLLGHAVAASGVMSALSGLFGFCPACWMIGRSPVRQPARDE